MVGESFLATYAMTFYDTWDEKYYKHLNVA